MGAPKWMKAETRLLDEFVQTALASGLTRDTIDWSEAAEVAKPGNWHGRARSVAACKARALALGLFVPPTPPPDPEVRLWLRIKEPVRGRVQIVVRGPDLLRAGEIASALDEAVCKVLAREGVSYEYHKES
jgi:hypothetical protein